MPRWFLKKRNVDLVELMDDPACDPERLDQTYAWFAVMNPWLARWRSVYARHLRPILQERPNARILDIGCGGGDLPRLIRKLALKDGFSPGILGIDPEERAISYARNAPSVEGVSFRSVLSSDLVREGERFDIILSNHVLHHLGEQELTDFLSDSVRLSSGLVLHNDICRDDLAWLGFWPIGAIPSLNSFILTDGLRSIRRAWHPEELQAFLPEDWEIASAVPFRTLLIHRQSP